MRKELETIRSLSLQEVEAFDRYFVDEILVSQGAMEVAWKQMRSLLSSTTATQLFALRHTYLRWYTMLTWRRLRHIDEEIFVSEIIPTQIPTALLLGFDIVEELFWYIDHHTVDEVGVEALYYKIQQAFMNSDMEIGTDNDGTSITIKSFVEQVRGLDSRGNDSVEMAEFYTKMADILTPAVNETNTFMETQYVDSEQAVTDLVDLTHFFMGVDKDHIWYLVETFINGESYEDALQGSQTENVEHGGETVEPAPADTSTETKPPKPTMKEIQAMVEEQFDRDVLGQFVHVEDVIEYLDQLADQHGDDTIRDLYFFDEEKGQYHWNNDLLR